MNAYSLGQNAHVVEILADSLSAHVCDADAAIDRILAGMGQLSGVDRAYVFQRKPGDLLDNTHEWCGPGIEPMIASLQNMPMDIIAPWREGFEQGETLHVPCVDDIDLDPALREFLAMQEIRGLLLVPLQWDGAIVGFVGFDRVQFAQPFSPEVLRILIAVAGAVGTILARAAANREIIRTRTELEKAVQQLRHLAMHDDLTGALNRRACHLAIEAALQSGQVAGAQTCVAMIDLARFKSINERYGHTEGDRLLREIVERWAKVDQRGAQVFRIGGDEFAVVLGAHDAGDAMQHLLADLREALARPFVLGDHTTRLNMRAGITLAPRDGATADILAANADLALLTAKLEKAEIRHFSPDLRRRALQRHETVQDLLAARPDQDFVLLYQPIIDLQTGRIAKVEALLRWRHPLRGLLEPTAFIEVLCGLDHSRKVGQWVLQTACQQVAGWSREFGCELAVCVNAFPLHVTGPDFLADLRAALAVSQLPAQALEIEITENIALQDGSQNLAVLRQLSDLAVGVSLDDFGTGFASLTSLTQMEVQTLKIDKSFVIGLVPDDPRLVVLRAIGHMAKGLGIRSVVEGIEDAASAALVRELGFDCGQGFYWSRPVDAATLARMLASEAGGVVRLSA